MMCKEHLYNDKPVDPTVNYCRNLCNPWLSWENSVDHSEMDYYSCRDSYRNILVHMNWKRNKRYLNIHQVLFCKNRRSPFI